MQTALLAAAFGMFAGVATAADIIGAGATFPYPIYAKWADVYKKQTGIGVNYQSIGSGGGIKQIQARTVDFGASDMPLKPDDLEKNGLMQFPAIMGGDVPVYNLKGIGSGQLKFTGELLADIYLGKITRWNDPAVAALNKDVKLPNEAITVVHRSDGSGTTFIWVNYLSKISPEWKSKVGEGTSVNWPVGVGGKGNEGVAAYVQRINGSIGYAGRRRTRGRRYRRRHRGPPHPAPDRALLPHRSRPLARNRRHRARVGDREACADASPGHPRNTKRARQRQPFHRMFPGTPGRAGDGPARERRNNLTALGGVAGRDSCVPSQGFVTKL